MTAQRRVIKDRPTLDNPAMLLDKNNSILGIVADFDEEKLDEVLVGYVAVNVAFLAIGDPGIVSAAADRFFSDGNFEDRVIACHPREHATPTGPSVAGTALVQTGIGDGLYPVYVHRDPKTGTNVRAVIQFIEHDN